MHKEQTSYNKIQKLSMGVMAAMFLLVLLGGLAAYVLVPDNAVTTAERRQLVQFPELTLKSWLDGTLADRLERYGQDQFPLRDNFRQAKALVQYDLLRRGDNNGLYMAEGHLAKIEYPLKPGEIRRAASKFADLADRYFAGCDLYYSVVPDKNYFLAEQSGRPAIDYGHMQQILADGLQGFTYIDIMDTVCADNYYRTDTHWKQQDLLPVARRIAAAMGVEQRIAWAFTQKTAGEFRGVFYGQAALPMEAEPLIYLTNDVLDGAQVYNLETDSYGGIYAPEKLTDGSSMDGYDLYLHGATPYVEIVNEQGGEQQLIVFRDSFGSSLVPLLTEAYGRIVVVDIRYIASDLLGQYVQVQPGDDVLFLYSALALNSASMLK